MATGVNNLPYPGKVYTPFDRLTAEELNEDVANIESLATGSGLGDRSVTAPKIDFTTLKFGNYSTTEQLTEFTYTSGEPIYKRTIFFDKGTAMTYVLNIGAGISAIIDYTAILRNANTSSANFLTLPYVGANFNETASFYRSSATGFTVVVGSSYAPTWRYGVITLLYTKV